MESLTAAVYNALDNGLLPDFLVRRAIRYLCLQRLSEIAACSISEAVESKWEYIEGLKQSAVAIETDKANEQHYEVRVLEELLERRPGAENCCRCRQSSFSPAWDPT